MSADSFLSIEVLTEDGSKVRVKDLIKGWTVLYVYPKDNTSGCTTEAKEFTQLLPEFRRLGVEVIGVSKDSPKSHQRFRQKHYLRITLVSDPETKLIKALGAWGQKKIAGKVRKGVIRSTFIINPEGQIVWKKIKVRAKGHAAKVLEVIKNLISSTAT